VLAEKNLLLKHQLLIVNRSLGVIAELTARLSDLGVVVSDVGQIIVNRISELLAHLRHRNSHHELGVKFGPGHASPPILEIEKLSPLPDLARSPPLANSSIDTPSRELNDTISSLTGDGLDPKLADLYGRSTDRSARLLVCGDLSVITYRQATERQLDEVAIRSRTQCHGLNESPLAACVAIRQGQATAPALDPTRDRDQHQSGSYRKTDTGWASSRLQEGGVKCQEHSDRWCSHYGKGCMILVIAQTAYP